MMYSELKKLDMRLDRQNFEEQRVKEELLKTQLNDM